MKDVLLSLIGDAPRPSLGSEGGGTPGFQQEESLERVDPRAGSPPVVVAVPFELGSHRFGHAPAVDVAETAQDAPGHPDAKGVDEFLPEQALSHGVDDERPLTRKMDKAPTGIQFQQLFQVQCLDAQTSPLGKQAILACPET
jgi:hypothetical protein